MRALVTIPLAVLFVAAIGYGICLATGTAFHPREMLLAAATCFIASELALIPILLTRGASQVAVAQAALVGTMIHLFTCTAVGGAMVVLKSLGLDNSIVYWLLAFYWTTLLVLAMSLIGAVKSASANTAVGGSPTSLKS